MKICIISPNLENMRQVLDNAEIIRGRIIEVLLCIVTPCMTTTGLMQIIPHLETKDPVERN